MNAIRPDIAARPGGWTRFATAPTGQALAPSRAGVVDIASKRINGYSVIERGEALGHDLWVDSYFLSQVAAAGNATGGRGVKSRLAHPGLSGDGLARLAGRSVNFRVEGDRVLADLHLSNASAYSPDGDVSDYVLKLAAESPDQFGASIVFAADVEGMDQFEFSNGGGTVEGFKSPDPLNLANLPHARLAQLRASDLVDEPAANTAGLFGFSDGEHLAEVGQAALDYLFGAGPCPDPSLFGGIAPERVRDFVKQDLARRGETPKKESGSMAENASVPALAVGDPMPPEGESPPETPVQPVPVQDGKIFCPYCSKEVEVVMPEVEDDTIPEMEDAPEVVSKLMSAKASKMKSLCVAAGVSGAVALDAIIERDTIEQFKVRLSKVRNVAAPRVPASQSVTHQDIVDGNQELSDVDGKPNGQAKHLAAANEYRAANPGVTLAEALSKTAPKRKH